MKEKKNLWEYGFSPKEQQALYILVATLWGCADHIAHIIRNSAEKVAHIPPHDDGIPMPEDDSVIESGWVMADKLFDALGIGLKEEP